MHELKDQRINESGTQRLKASKHPSIKASRHQRIKESKNRRIKESKNQRSKESKNRRIEESKNQRTNEPKNQRIKESKDQRIKESKNHRIKESKIQRIKESKNQRTKDATNQRNKESKHQKCWSTVLRVHFALRRAARADLFDFGFICVLAKSIPKNKLFLIVHCFEICSGRRHRHRKKTHAILVYIFLYNQGPRSRGLGGLTSHRQEPGALNTTLDRTKNPNVLKLS